MPYIQKNGKQFGLADISITTGVQCREMTQAQYDALSTEEKNNGTVYFIVGGKQDNLYISDTVPIGAIQAYGGSSAPAGWLMCNGMAVNRTVYKELFAVIGTTYGEGDTVTTFNLPNLNGRVAVGAGTGYVLGAEGGEASHKLTVDEIPSHKHHILTNNDDFNGTQSGSPYGTIRDGTTAWYNTTWYTENEGGDQAHNNMQPYLVTNYIIKAKDTYQVGSSGGGSGGGGSVTIDSTAIPSPNMVAEFDDSAKMNSTDMSSQEITNFINTIDAQGANLADYVVEQGTNYTKWNSGKLEQWGLEASASSTNHIVNFPVSFVSTAYVIVGTNTSGTQANFMTSSTSVSSFTVYPSASTKLYWIAIGKWK